MTLNDKVANILKEHEGGEKFFDALDMMIRGDRDILKEFVNFALTGMSLLTDTVRFTSYFPVLVLTGKFGIAILNNFEEELRKYFGDIILVNGGLRKDENPVILKYSIKGNSFCFWDDSIYSGNTRDKIMKSIQEMNPKASLVRSYVVYDGMKQRDENTKALFRYYGNSNDL